MVNYNKKRIERDIEKYIPSIIYEEVKDEYLHQITITDCKLAHDLSFCKVYFTSLSEDPHNIQEKKCNEASAFIRGKLAAKMNLRNTPIIHFAYDESIEYASKIENIIDNLHK